MKDSSIKIMAEGAVMLALSAALSLLSFKPMPQGGSVDITMVPILIFAIVMAPYTEFLSAHSTASLMP